MPATARLFYKNERGTVVVIDAKGLPVSDNPCIFPIFALHVHSGGSCLGNENDPFSSAGMHYNPRGCPHPYHAGDLPPLFCAGGYAFLAALTDRFSVDEIIGKTVVLHAQKEDFFTQPAGNAGERIACGEIVKSHRKF